MSKFGVFVAILLMVIFSRASVITASKPTKPIEYRIAFSVLPQDVIATIKNVNISDQEITFRGCNFFNVSYKLNGNKVAFGSGFSTMMACQIDFDSKFVESLTSATKMVKGNKSVTFYGPKGKSILRLQAI